MQWQDLREFWALVQDVWQRSLWDVGVGSILSALAILFLFLVLRGLFTRFVIAQIARLTRRSAMELDDEIVAAMQGPLRLVPIVLGVFLASKALGAEGQLAVFLGELNRSLVIFTIFWGLYQIIAPAVAALNRAQSLLTEGLLAWLSNVSRAVIALLGGAAMLESWGIRVGPLLAGLGLFGVAVALGAQDLFKNLIAGLFIIAERRYNIGDWISVDNVVEGVVEQIGFRTTKVRRFDKAPVYVPNSQISDSAMTNFSQMSHRRIYWKINLEYRTTLDQLRRIREQIEMYLMRSDEFAKPPEVPLFVRIDSFAESSIDLLLYTFTKTTQWGEWLQIKEGLAYQVKQIVEANEAGFAFPSQSVYVEAVPPETRLDEHAAALAADRG